MYVPWVRVERPPSGSRTLNRSLRGMPGLTVLIEASTCWTHSVCFCSVSASCPALIFVSSARRMIAGRMERIAVRTKDRITLVLRLLRQGNDGRGEFFVLIWEDGPQIQ